MFNAGTEKFENSELMAVLERIKGLVRERRFENVETDWLELKPTPSENASWAEVEKSICAFLNSRGGVIVLGIRENEKTQPHRYEFTGWRSDSESKLKSLTQVFVDPDDRPLEIASLLDLRIQPFLEGQIAILSVNELRADLKFARIGRSGKAWKRAGTGDHEIQVGGYEWKDQLNYREEAQASRELTLIPDTSLESIDLDALNQVIVRLNRGRSIETVKTSLEAARSYLERKNYMRSGQVTMLGMLVCGSHPGDHLEFRARADGYVDLPGQLRADKQHFEGHVLELIEDLYRYVQRSTMLGVDKTVKSGSPAPEYPFDLLSEMINNAFTHRDYSINKPVRATIRPHQSLSISNPGRFRSHLQKRLGFGKEQLLRIVPENKPTNPKLANILRFFEKWEGRSIGMATLVDLCIKNEIDLPYYRFLSDEVELVLRPGKLVGDRMNRHFERFDGFISEKLGGFEIDEIQKTILAYLIKSEWENRRNHYTVLLTHDNNHSGEMQRLESSGLIVRHPESDSVYPVFVAARELVELDEPKELSDIFGNSLKELGSEYRDILRVVHRVNMYSKKRLASAKQVAFALWYETHESHDQDIRQFDRFYRSVRNKFNKLDKDGFLKKSEKNGYVINRNRTEDRLL
jgi:ATP-dependent DNA helicase RecG